MVCFPLNLGEIRDLGRTYEGTLLQNARLLKSRRNIRTELDQLGRHLVLICLGRV